MKFSSGTPSAKIIADSISPEGYRLTTMQVTMHRFVLSEFNTHRKFSRNSASSRAIPLKKQIQMVEENPAFPLVWQAEKSGMQGGEELTGHSLLRSQAMWEDQLDSTLNRIKIYLREVEDNDETPLHKSWVNRLLEPFMWHTVCVTSTEWMNFFVQRCSPLAQPEIRYVAEAMLVALDVSEPKEVSYSYFDVPGDNYHLPYLQPAEGPLIYMNGYDIRSISIARSARVSYLTQEGVRDYEKDQQLYERLLSPHDGPPHWSPFEHVARPARKGEVARGNFDGWIQRRQEIIEERASNGRA